MTSRHIAAGVVFGSSDGSLSHLPLVEVKINALVIDVSARVDIVQSFYNPSRGPTPRAKYVFPVPSRAAICAFDMATSSGRVIVGVAKEKDEAKQTHEQAIQEGKTTALVEWVTDDIFTISLGSIAGRDRITTTISYVMDLMDNDVSTEVRLQIPMCVGERYGEVPEGMDGASGPSAHTRVRFNANIQMKGVIASVTSPSHPGVHVAAYQTHVGRPSRHRATVRFRSPYFLHSDFVLVVKAAGLDRPRCFAEHDPRGSGSLAMQLTLMPKFDLPPVQSQEYIFLVDRSGSMRNSRIETAKRTLSMLLRALPFDGTTLNIFSFGSRCDSLWTSSMAYSDAVLAQATQHIAGMDANYGGTEIRNAVGHVCASRDRSRPTAMFMLTDGEAYDEAATAQVVKNAVASAAPHAPLRIFILGIGNTTSTAMCEHIAREGNGTCLMAMSTEELTDKCAKLMRAGRSFLLKNISIDWGIPPDALRQPQDSSTVLTVQQVPAVPAPLYPGVRYIVFLLVKHATFAVPKTITILAQRDGAGEMLRLPVPVELVRFGDENDHRLVHTLAARRLIMDLEDNAVGTGMLGGARMKDAIVELGTTYQLVSRHTSFVAVEDDGETPLPIPRPAWAKSVAAQKLTNTQGQGRVEQGFLGGAADYVDKALTYGGLFVSEFLKTWFGLPPRSEAPDTPSHAGDGPDAGNDDPGEEDYSDNTFTTLSSLITRSDWSDTSDSRPPTPDPITRSPSPDLQVDPRSRDTTTHSFTAPAATALLDAQVEGLVNLQAANGSFADSPVFKQLIGIDNLDEVRPAHADPRLWATAVAVAFLTKHMGGQRDLLECLLEKALEFVGSVNVASGSVDFDALVVEATKVIR